LLYQELTVSTYKINVEIFEESSNNEDDDLLSHIFKKQKVENDELNAYLNEGVVSSKTDILIWWKVYFNIFITYF